MALGFAPGDIEWDHTPPLALREWDEKAGDFIPPQNDPKFITITLKASHRAKTFGPGGERRITTAGSDIHAIAKVRRIAKDPSGGEEFRRRLLARPPPEEREQPRKKWPSRPFNSKKESKNHGKR